MKYDFKCKNPDCKEFEKVKEYDIKVAEYKIPNCVCGQEMVRVYNTLGIKTNDGYKK